MLQGVQTSADLVVNLNLVDARLLIFNRVLDRTILSVSSLISEVSRALSTYLNRSAPLLERCRG